jgi:Zn-dependent peptidase ImmA (M78 family)
VAKPAPINVDVLNWAIDDAGLSNEQISATSKALTPEKLRAIRRGDHQPLTTEFKALAKALGRSTSFFFLPSAPTRQPLAAAFRTPATHEGHRSLSAGEHEALRSATRWQRIVTWAREPESSARLPQVKPDASSADVAVTISRWLEWSLELQRSFKTPNAVLKELRDRLEDRGLIFLQFTLGNAACKGFSVPGDTPVIALNSSYNPAARVYTIIHELIHVMQGDRAVCGKPREDELERFCESAAAIFLIPERDLRNHLKTRFPKPPETVAEVGRIANRYNVSLRATALRLTELNLARPGLYDLVDNEAEYGGGGGFGGEPQTTPVRRIRELGQRIPRELIRARDDGRLPDVEVRRYLDVSGEQLRDIERRLHLENADI